MLCFLGWIQAQNTNPHYDASLSEKLQADDYGMKSYILVILKSGPFQTQDTEFVSECFQSHIKNIELLVDEKKMIVAGPIFKNEKNYRGIFILDVKTIEEANELLQKDLAIKEKLLEPEFFVWYGSAALPSYLLDADKIWKVKP